MLTLTASGIEAIEQALPIVDRIDRQERDVYPQVIPQTKRATTNSQSHTAMKFQAICTLVALGLTGAGTVRAAGATSSKLVNNSSARGAVAVDRQLRMHSTTVDGERHSLQLISSKPIAQTKPATPFTPITPRADSFHKTEEFVNIMR